MSKQFVFVAVLLLVCSFAVAEEVAAPAPVAPVAPAAPAVEAPPAIAVTVDGLTSEDVLQKSTAAYKAAKTYYEESSFVASADINGQHQEQSMKLVAAFKRPDTIKIDITGQPNVTVFHTAEATVVFNRDLNQFVKQPPQTLEQFSKSLQQFPTVCTAVAADPYAFLKEGVLKVVDIKAAVFNGQPVYEVDFEQPQGVSVANYFDKKNFFIAGIKATVPMSAQQGVGSLTFTVTVDKLFIDEVPKDASGKEIDAFAFVLPEGATQVTPPPLAGPQPEPMPESAPTTDSK